MFEAFQQELQSVINRNCVENGSGTPDFILAAFLRGQIEAINKFVAERESWYGRTQDPTFGTPLDSAIGFIEPIDENETQSETTGFKVITADFGISVKVVGLLDRSTDEVNWINSWLDGRAYGTKPFAVTVTEFDGFGAPPTMPGAYVYVVQAGKVIRGVANSKRSDRG